MIFGWKGRGQKRIAAIVKPEELARAINAAAGQSLKSMQEKAGPDELAAFAICVDDNILSPFMVGCTRAWFDENTDNPERAKPVEWSLTGQEPDMATIHDLFNGREAAREAEEEYFIDRFGADNRHDLPRDGGWSGGIARRRNSAR